MTATNKLLGAEFLDPFGAVSGEAISHWSQDWWNMAYTSLLISQDVPGAQLDTAPSGGQMYLLGGSFGGDVANSFAVNANTPLLVPIFNILYAGFTGTGPDPKNFVTGTPAAAEAAKKAWVQDLTAHGNMFLSLTDNGPGGATTIESFADILKNDYAQTGWFTLNLGDFGTIPKCQSAGYWAVVEGLQAGHSYTLTFGGNLNGFAVKTVDHITAN